MLGVICKKGIIAVIISFALSLFVSLGIPLSSLFHGFDVPLEDFVALVGFNLFYMSLFILAVGLPISIGAFFIVGNVKNRRRLLNFSIHVFSSAIIGILIFTYSMGFALYSIYTIIAGFLFFIGDELCIYTEHRKQNRHRLWSSGFIALAIPGLLLLVPSFGIEGEKPGLTREFSLYWNEKSLTNIDLVHCKVEEKGCSADKSPYIQTDADENLDTIDTYYSNTAEIKLSEWSESTIEVYYLENDQVKQLELIDHILVIPNGLQEQVMKGNIIWEDEVLSFSIAVK